jgi:8-oxo-dGTP diphosphatase
MRYLLLLIRIAVAIPQWVTYFLSFGRYPPPFAAAVVLVRRNDEVLLIDRRDGLGMSLPGGFVGLRERCEDAARREVREETGLDIEVGSVIRILSGKRRGTKICSVAVVYDAKIIGEERIRDSSEGRCLWVKTKDIDKYRIAFDYMDVLGSLKE